MRIDFSGRRAVVTGAGKGIGRAVALRLAAAGASVVAVSRPGEDLDSVAAETKGDAIAADLADAAAAERAAADACSRFGPVDLLVNNAGISVPQPFLDTTVDAWDRTFAVNVRAAMLFGQAFARAVIGRGAAGAAVNLSSQASQVALADHAAYCASKGALDQLTRVMALELGPHGIRVNAVNPTVTLTPMGRMAWADAGKSAAMKAKIPLGRFAEVDDVADAVLYLLSDHAAMVHGVTLPVDGGFLAC